jgi:hypothetical protein
MLIKSATALERLAEIDTVVFDKTGTLTEGKPELVNLGDHARRDLEIALALAEGSGHPLAGPGRMGRRRAGAADVGLPGGGRGRACALLLCRCAAPRRGRGGRSAARGGLRDPCDFGRQPGGGGRKPGVIEDR